MRGRQNRGKVILIIIIIGRIKIQNIKKGMITKEIKKKNKTLGLDMRER